MPRAQLERRNALLVLLMITVLGALVALALREGPIKIMAGQPLPTDLEAQRESADNAYNALRELLDNAPKRPSNVRNGAVSRYRPAPESLGNLLGLLRPDDDPELLDYVAACQTQAAGLRDALEHPLYVAPEAKKDGLGVEHLTNFRYTARCVIAAAAHRARSETADQEVFERLFDVIRLGRLVAAGGPSDVYRTSHDIQRYALEWFPELAHRAPEGFDLETIQTRLAEATAPPPSPVPCLEYTWRQLDDRLGEPAPGRSHRHRRRARELVKQYRYAWGVKEAQRRVIRDKEALIAAAQMTPVDYAAWKRTAQEVLEPHPLWNIEQDLDRLVEFRAGIQAWARMARLAVALERCWRDQGAWPGTLDALAPGYLAEPLVDPFSGAPFIYRPDEDRYWLYSVGENGKDDGGDAELDKDLVMLRPKRDEPKEKQPNPARRPAQDDAPAEVPAPPERLTPPNVAPVSRKTQPPASDNSPAQDPVGQPDVADTPPVDAE